MGFVSFSEDVQEQLDANMHLRPERHPTDVTVRLPQASVILIRCKACGCFFEERVFRQHKLKAHSKQAASTRKALASATPLPKAATSPRHLVKCIVCHQAIREDRLVKHLRKAHPATAPATAISPTSTSLESSLIKCAICHQSVRLNNVEKHMRKAHSATLPALWSWYPLT
jgi:hypothetical protein